MIGDDLLFEYALDLLSSDERARVEAAVARDPALRGALDEIRDVLSAVPSTLEAVTPTADARARLLTATIARPRLVEWTDRVAKFLDVATEKARALLTEIGDAARWESSPWEGVTLFHFDLPGQYAGADVGFVQVDAGQHFPFHEHLGEERVIVLQGGYRDAGRVWGPGDEDTRPAGSRHDYTALDESDLIYLVVLYEGLECLEP